MTVKSFNSEGMFYRAYQCVTRISKCEYSEKFTLTISDRHDCTEIKLSTQEVRLEVES